MKTIKEKIDDKRKELQQAREAAWRVEKELRLLEESRVDCEHVWDNGVKGYEHEGVHCIKCGINDMYASTLEKYRKTARYEN